jgi:hypothetical protein
MAIAHQLIRLGGGGALFLPLGRESRSGGGVSRPRRTPSSASRQLPKGEQLDRATYPRRNGRDRPPDLELLGEERDLLEGPRQRGLRAAVGLGVEEGRRPGAPSCSSPAWRC